MGLFTCRICGGPTIGGPCSKCRTKTAVAVPQRKTRTGAKILAAHGGEPMADWVRNAAGKWEKQESTSKSFDKLHRCDTLAEAHDRARDRLEQKGLPDFVTQGYVKATVDPKLQAIAWDYAAAYKRIEREANRVADAGTNDDVGREITDDRKLLHVEIDKDGMDYALVHYSDWKGIKDAKFHAALRAYAAVRTKLVTYLHANV